MDRSKIKPLSAPVYEARCLNGNDLFQCPKCGSLFQFKGVFVEYDVCPVCGVMLDFGGM